MPASAIFMPQRARRNNMDYFYEHESELFTFYRVPKVLFTEEPFKNMNCEAKLLYGWRTWAAPTARWRSCYPNWSKLACCAGNGRGWGSRLHCTP